MDRSRKIGVSIVATALLIGLFTVSQAFGAALTSSVTVSNAAPVVSAVTLNGGSAITLTGNTTTNVNVVATISDNNGCSDITGGTTTILLYRTGVGSSTCLTTPNNANCYIATAFTASSSCAGTSVNTTTTFPVYYFAQATDASSSFSSQGWKATVIFKDPSNASNSAESGTSTMNTLLSINVTTGTIAYGTLAPQATSPIATTTIQNAGNCSSTLQTSAQVTLTAGGNTITTSSQHYATTSFTYGVSDVALASAPSTVSGFFLIGPTSTNPIQQNLYWALQVPSAQPTGTYSGTNLLTAVYSP